MSSLQFINDPDVTPEDAAKIINALAKPGAKNQITAGANAIVGAAGSFAEIRGATYILLGDSIAANNALSVGNNFTNFQAEGFFNWANALLGAPFRFLNSFAAGGKTSAQVIQEQLPKVAAMAVKPAYAVLNIGVNDIYAAGRSATAVFTDISYIVNALLDMGIIPIYSTVMARSFSSAPLLAAHLALNDLLKKAAQEKTTGIFWDAFQVTVDPTSTQCNIRSGWTYDSAPNIHLNNVGAYYAGKKLAAVIKSTMRTPAVLPAGDENYTNGGSFNLLDNPMLLGTAVAPGTGGTGNGPAGFVIQRVAGSPTWTTAMVDVTDPDTGLAIGKGIQLTITATAANDEIQILSNNFAARMGAGQTFEAECRLVLESPVNVDRVRLKAGADSGSGEAGWVLTGAQTLSNLPEGFGPATFRTRAIKALGSVIFGQFDCRIRFSAAGSAVFTVSAPRLRQL